MFEYIKKINAMTEDEQIEMLDKNIYFAKFIESPSVKVQMYLVNKDITMLSHYKTLSDEVQADILDKFKTGDVLILQDSDLKYSFSKEYQMLYVTEYNISVLIFRDVDITVKEYLIRNNQMRLCTYIDLPESLQLEMIDSNTKFIQYINNPTDRVLKRIVTEDVESMMHVLSPLSMDIVIAILLNADNGILLINDKSYTEEIVDYIVENTNQSTILVRRLEFTKSPLLEYLIMKNNSLIGYLEKVDPKLALDVFNNGYSYAIKYMEQTEENQIEAVEMSSNKNILAFLNNPNDKVMEKYNKIYEVR